MRVWLVTARDKDLKFVDQRRIEAPNQASGESYAREWIARVGGDQFTSLFQEITKPGSCS